MDINGFFEAVELIAIKLFNKESTYENLREFINVANEQWKISNF